MNRLKEFFKKILFGEPLLMSVYQDENGNEYGGVIHKNDGKSYIDYTGHIVNPKFLGKIKIY